MTLRRCIVAVLVLAAAVLATPTRAGNSMESQVFSMINGERSKPLIEHAGLLQAARAHSQEMAMSGGLNHDGADERVANAQPDPPEANGAPDDGFAPAAWCENVTYSTGFPESQVAQKLYQQWRNSAPHQACMTNSSKNVGAVGIYYDGSTWWATFIAEVDSTPPGGARPAAAPAAAPKSQATPAARAPVSGPAASQAPASGQPASAEPAGILPSSVSTPVQKTAPGQAANASAAPTRTAQEVSLPSPQRFTVSVHPMTALRTWRHSRHVAEDVMRWAAIVALEVLFLIAMRGARVWWSQRYPKMRRVATSAPSRSTRSFSQEMSSAMVRKPAAVSKPQSVPARTLVGSPTA
jgi:hypothetical protein